MDTRSQVRQRSTPFLKLSLLICLLSILSACSGTGSPSILDAHSAEAIQIANYTWLLFGVATIVFLVVTALLVIAILRGRRETLAADPSIHDSRTLRLVVIGGAVIPAVVLLILMSLGVVIENAYAAVNPANVTVEVIGRRWWWEIRYPDLGIVTANEIHIPVGEPVQIRVTSADVIHSFWVPQLHGKIDLIPGQTNTISMSADQAGVYRGICAEYCGDQHTHMQFLVIADQTDDFQTWVSQQQKPAADPDSSQPESLEGQQAFLGSSCVYCHAVQGTNASGTLGPDLTHLASRITIGAGMLPNNHGNLAGWIMNAQSMKPGNLMPPMDLDSNQLQAILTYLETLQ